MEKPTYTITFGNMGENHIGMQKIGIEIENGFNKAELDEAKTKFEEFGCDCVLYDLVDMSNVENAELILEKAYVLHIKNGVNKILESIGKTHHEAFIEQKDIVYNKKFWDRRRKKVLNKNARYNSLFAQEQQDADYENGKGTIIAFDDVPLLNKVRLDMSNFLGEKANDLIAEGNYYYDIKKCGIGYHGDTERKIVIAYRLGERMPLVYQWYWKHKRIGDKMTFDIKSGDIYVMSEKAVGYDWKRSSIPTLRHSAGCDKYTK